MRFVLILAAACATVAGPALAQEWRPAEAHAHRTRGEEAYRPAWRQAEAPAEHWSQYYGRSYSDGDLWTPNSANGS
jgi:hypothetical protein